MLMHTTIACVMPAYNAAKWIRRAIQSVLDQDRKVDEIIVVDDGSGDETVDEVRSFGGRVTLVRADRQGGAGARNLGIRQASSDWIAFLDADDAWLPHHLRNFETLVAPSDDVAYTSNRNLMDTGGREWSTAEPYGCPAPVSGLNHTAFIRYFYRKPYFSMCGTIVRRARLEEIGGLDVNLVRRHDIDMWLRSISGRTWAYHPVASNLVRVDTPGSISKNIANAEFFCLRALLNSEDAFPIPEMKGLIQRVARRAVASAITDGTPQDRQRAIQLALPRLRPRDRLLMELSLRAPRMFRWLNRERRKRLVSSDLLGA